MERIVRTVVRCGRGRCLACSSAMAEEFSLFGRTGDIYGYVSQEASYGLHNDFNTEHGWNAALNTTFVEGDYNLADNLKLYAAGKLTSDLIYQTNAHRSDWVDKQFDESKRYLNVDDKDWQILDELHATYKTDSFQLRVGKQIVSWGEILGPSLLSQFNPADERRGFTSVELETATIPTWLIRADYFVPCKPTWLTDLALQFIFDPHAEQIPTQGGQLFSGNNLAGIWADKIVVPIPGLGSFLYGAPVANIENRQTWTDGQKFGFQAKGVTSGGDVITADAFYGYNNTPVAKMAGSLFSTNLSAPSPIPPIFLPGQKIMNPVWEGYYPLQRFAGLTYFTELQSLRSSFTGGVAPTISWEAKYDYRDAFAAASSSGFRTSNQISSVLEVDWKTKIDFLNPMTYFSFTGQLNYGQLSNTDIWRQQVQYLGHPASYSSLLLITTSYLHQKLTPTFSWVHDFYSNTDILGYELAYAPNTRWTYSLGAQQFNTNKVNEGFYIFDNKDLIYFKMQYKWG